MLWRQIILLMYLNIMTFGVYNGSKQLIRRLDVKSTTYTNGKVSYTIRNGLGQPPITTSKALNKNNVQLVFVFGKNFKKMYFVNMDLWYNFIEEQKHNWLRGKTYVMDRNFNHIFKDMPFKGRTDMFEYYKVCSVAENICGEETKKWVAHAYIDGEFGKEVDLKKDKYGDWYFENNSRYILVSQDLLKKLCVGSGHIINT